MEQEYVKTEEEDIEDQIELRIQDEIERRHSERDSELSEVRQEL